MPFIFDAADFDPASIPADALALNAEIIAKLTPIDSWAFTPAQVREARKAGRGPFPLAPKSPRAEVMTIAGKRGPIELRIIAPEQPKGVFLHIHGGGWVLGANDTMDPRFVAMADRIGWATVSVAYGLAPEAPYPAGPDDCETAALWLVKEGAKRFGTTVFAIGGESAGAHLSLVTLLRLRDRHGLTPFRGANLHAGCYDLALTPSARRFHEKLVLSTRDIEMFVRHYLVKGGDVRDSDISPIHADLRGLPEALITVGTQDALLDDSLLLAGRWAAAGNAGEVRLYPGGCHVFIAFDGTNSQACLSAMETFLVRL